MTFTKKKLPAALAGAVVAAASQSAYSIVDLDNTAGVGMLVASETVIDPVAGIDIISTGADAFTVVGLMNANTIPINTGLRVTVTLSSGTFAGAPTLQIANTTTTASTGNTATCGATGARNANCPTFAILTGGGTADSSVTFNTDTAGTIVPFGQNFVFDLNAAGLNVADQSPITITVDTQIADNFGSTAIGSISGQYINWGPIATLGADATGAEAAARIDVTANSLAFTGGANADRINVGGYRITEDTTGATGSGTIPVSVTGTAITTANIVGNVRPTINAANGFSTFNQGTATGSTGVSTARGGCTFSTADATIATCGAYAPGAGGEGAGANAVTLRTLAGTSNTVQIAETTLTASVIGTAAAAAFSTAGVVGTVDLLPLRRNGSSARLNFALTPGGNFPMFIRVTNPSAIAGPVTLTLTNDDGTTSTAIPITAIAGGPAGDLAAGASTALLDINDVMDAVQAADATFALGASNKLRVNVVAEFGANASITGGGTGSASVTQNTGETGVILSAFSVSSDGTTFNMLTEASQ
jgi:hypothetical protein